MTLHQLKILLAVAKHQSVTEAAKEMHISQPSVSQQLRLLEEECGAKLYRRTAHGIDLTEAGRIFLGDAEPILIQIEKLTTKFRSTFDEGKVESLAIGGSYGPSASFLPSTIALFRKGHPQVEINLITNSSPTVEELLLKSKIEVAVVIRPSRHPNIVLEPCRKEELVLCASVRHRLAKKRELTLKELQGVPLVIRKEEGDVDAGSTWNIVKRLVQRGVTLHVAMHCELPEMVKAAIKAGVGLGILHRDIAEPDVRAGYLKIIKTPELEMRADSFIAYHKEKPLSSNATDFLALLRQCS